MTDTPDLPLPDGVPETAPIFVISIAAELSGMHPQTLRQYDRLGLVSPGRAPGRGRRYSARDIEQLREVQRLSQEEGVSLAGVKRILELENHVAALRARIAELQAALEDSRLENHRLAADVERKYRRDLVPLRDAARGAVVVWRPPHRPR